MVGTLGEVEQLDEPSHTECFGRIGVQVEVAVGHEHNGGLASVVHEATFVGKGSAESNWNLIDHRANGKE